MEHLNDLPFQNLVICERLLMGEEIAKSEPEVQEPVRTFFEHFLFLELHKENGPRPQRRKKQAL